MRRAVEAATRPLPSGKGVRRRSAPGPCNPLPFHGRVVHGHEAHDPQGVPVVGASSLWGRGDPLGSRRLTCLITFSARPGPPVVRHDRGRSRWGALGDRPRLLPQPLGGERPARPLREQPLGSGASKRPGARATSGAGTLRCSVQCVKKGEGLSTIASLCPLAEFARPV